MRQWLEDEVFVIVRCGGGERGKRRQEGKQRKKKEDRHHVILVNVGFPDDYAVTVALPGLVSEP